MPSRAGLVFLGLALPVLLACVGVACGSRTGLEPGARDASPESAGPDAVAGDDAGAPADAAGFDGACPAAILRAPAGTVLWETPLVADDYLVGPLAADDAGSTYFVDDGYLVGGKVDGGSTILALDECGKVRWRAPWNHFYNDSVTTYLMVSGSQLVAENADVQGFDLATGAHLWTADLVAFAAKAGLGDVSTSDSLRSPVATADGNVFLSAYTPAESFLLRIDPSGAPSVVAPLALTQGGGFETDMVVDPSGHLDLAMVFTNVSPGPGAVVSLARDGTTLQTFPLTLGYLDQLMPGMGYLLSGDSATRLDLTTGAQRGLGTQLAQPAVVDGAGNVVAIGSATSNGVSAVGFDPAGQQRWTTMLPDGAAFSYAGGPLLGDGPQAFLLSVLLLRDTQSTAVSSLSVDTGALHTWTFPERSPGTILLNASGELVFALGKRAVAVSSGGERPPRDSLWPTPRGGIEQRSAALGQ